MRENSLNINQQKSANFWQNSRSYQYECSGNRSLLFSLRNYPYVNIATRSGNYTSTPIALRVKLTQEWGFGTFELEMYYS